MGLYDYAWKSQIEAIYGGLQPTWVVIGDSPPTKAWLSPDTAALWRRTAENAWKAGEHSLAYEYLAKAAIFGPDEEVDKAKALVKRWREGKPEPAPTLSHEERQKLLKEIVVLYLEIGVPPRALELIEKYHDWLDNPGELRADCVKRWKEVVRQRSHGGSAKHLVIFGVRVTDTTDPASIHVPFACDPARVKEVSENVSRLVNVAVFKAVGLSVKDERSFRRAVFVVVVLPTIILAAVTVWLLVRKFGFLQ